MALAWELYSDSGLNQRDGQQRQLVPRIGLTRGDTPAPDGFTAGGPAFKNKLFGFGSMELSRYYGNGIWLEFTFRNKMKLNEGRA